MGEEPGMEPKLKFQCMVIAERTQFIDKPTHCTVQKQHRSGMFREMIEEMTSRCCSAGSSVWTTSWQSSGQFERSRTARGCMLSCRRVFPHVSTMSWKYSVSEGKKWRLKTVSLSYATCILGSWFENVARPSVVKSVMESSPRRGLERVIDSRSSLS